MTRFICCPCKAQQRGGALLVASVLSLPPLGCSDVASPPSDSSGSGGSEAFGGAAGSSNGGAGVAGGLSGTGGSAVGASTGLGGAVGNGGSGGSGGMTGGSAGASIAGAGGSLGNGGTVGSGGSTGGTSSSGGSTGGVNGSGGSGGTSNTCVEPDKTVCNNEIGSHCGYTYEYWKDQGTGCLVNTSDGFSVDWSNINNLLGRKGMRPGSSNQVVTYQADYQPNGNSYLCVYGWTKNPLVEYYVVDSWGSWRPPGGTSIGTVSSDGGTYDIYRTQRVNQPSIEGTKTFDQYWSVRTQKRTSGTITVANHFSAWAGQGMNMGSMYEVSMTVEGYQSSGTANVSFTMK